MTEITTHKRCLDGQRIGSRAHPARALIAPLIVFAATILACEVVAVLARWWPW